MMDCSNKNLNKIENADYEPGLGEIQQLFFVFTSSIVLLGFYIIQLFIVSKMKQTVSVEFLLCRWMIARSCLCWRIPSHSHSTVFVSAATVDMKRKS